jgi:hypothetical protein
VKVAYKQSDEAAFRPEVRVLFVFLSTKGARTKCAASGIDTVFGGGGSGSGSGGGECKKKKDANAEIILTRRSRVDKYCILKMTFWTRERQVILSLWRMPN